MHQDVDGQREIDFSELERFRIHLIRCGFSETQAAFAALVLQRGERRSVGDEMQSVLSITGREAALRLGSKWSRQAVEKAAYVLGRHEWFHVVRQSKPKTYVLDAAGARSLVPLGERLDEFTKAPKQSGPPGGCNLMQPDATECNPMQPVAVSMREEIKNTCSPCSPWPRAQRRRLPAVADGCRRLRSAVPYPWMRDKGITDEELKAAVREMNIDLLAWMHDVAIGLRWIKGLPAEHQHFADGSWFRFLVCAHHTATSRGIPDGVRMACLVIRGAGKKGPGGVRTGGQFETKQTSQASDQWAGRVFNQRWRDPELAKSERIEH